MLIIRVTLYLVVILLVADVAVIGLLVALIKKNVVIKYSIWSNSTNVADEITAEIGNAKLSFNFDKAGELLQGHQPANTTGVLFEYLDTDLASNSTTPMTLTAPGTESDPPRPYENLRLPAHVVPLAYELYLRVNLTTDVFGGKCTIDVKVTAPTSFFIVHAASILKVTETKVWRVGVDGRIGEAVQQKSAFSHPENEFWVVELTSAVDPGLYTLQINYEGALVGDGGLQGLHKVEYVNKVTGKKSALVVSIFEPTFARNAFPCFDEPNRKSTFDVTIIHDAGYVALSNMPAVKQKSLEDGVIETKFLKSVPMSTYLVTFVVGELKWKSTTTKDGKTLSVYATADQLKNADYALNAGRIAYDYYSEYFGVDYPLPKLVPNYEDAVENWGAILLSEFYMLFDPKESGVRSAYDILVVVTHEIAHQWFGNLVTMDWWDDIWLNEGFANYLQYAAGGKVEPTWNQEEDTVVTDLQRVMDLDAGVGSHSIIQSVNHPDEINDMFDVITYRKGSSVIRMLDSFLGKDNFRRGLKSYLTKYSYANAKSSELWTELSASSSQNLDVGAIMATWTEQIGFPLITIKRSSTDPSKFTAEQERFFSRPDAKKSANQSESKFNYVWQVPLTYRQLDGSNAIIWMDGPKKSFQLPWAKDHAVKFNVDQTGYFKVNYEVETWKEVAMQLQDDHQFFSRLDRVNLLDDAMTLAKASYLDYSIALNVTRYLVKESDFMPWYAVRKNLMAISNLLHNTDLYQDFREYILQLATPIYTRLGWKDEGSYLNKKLRALILDMSCYHEYKSCLTEAQNRIKMRIDGKYVGPNLRETIYRYGIASSQGTEVWDAIWKRYTESSFVSEKNSLLHGLTFAKQPYLINRLLHYTKNETLISSQDVIDVFCFMSENPSARGILWDFYRSEYKYFEQRFQGNPIIGGTLLCTTQWFAEEFRLQEMLDFFEKYPEAGAVTRARQKAIENVKTNIDWTKRQKGSLKLWLQTFNAHRN